MGRIGGGSVTRTPAAAPQPHVRILTYPKHNKPDLRLKVCTPTAIQDLSVPKRNKAWYAAARRLDWGDALPLDTTAKKPDGNP